MSHPILPMRRPKRWKNKSSGGTKYDLRSTICKSRIYDFLRLTIRQSSIVNPKFLLSSPHEPGAKSEWIDSRRRRIDADGDRQGATGLATGRVGNSTSSGTDFPFRGHPRPESIHRCCNGGGGQACSKFLFGALREWLS